MSNSTAARALPRPNTRPAARPATQPRLRVVAPRTGHSRAGLAILCISLLVVGLLALLLLNISIGNGAYTLTALQKTQTQATEQQQALAEQVDNLSAPQELANRATKLGMVPAPNTAFVRLSDGTVIGTAAKAVAPPKKVAKATAALQGSGLLPAKKPATTKTTGKATTGKATTGKASTGRTGTTTTSTGTKKKAGTTTSPRR